jgi:hypothetical protein
MTNPLKSLIQTIHVPASNDFQPTPAQRRAKAAYWSTYFQSGNLPPTQVTPAHAARVSGYSEVQKWWASQEFQDWFLNGEEFKQQVEYTSALALDFIQATIQDPLARPADRLAASKLALEVSNKFPKGKQSESDSQDPLSSMSRQELEQFIANKLTKLQPSSKEEPAKEVDIQDTSVVK